jgi:hypothetical protein
MNGRSVARASCCVLRGLPLFSSGLILAGTLDKGAMKFWSSRRSGSTTPVSPREPGTRLYLFFHGVADIRSLP